jgi:hypothetical protein
MSSKFQGQLSMAEAGKKPDLKPIHPKVSGCITYFNLKLDLDAKKLVIAQHLKESNHPESHPYSSFLFYFNHNCNGNIHVTHIR